jgi:hypothetical protein
MGQAATPAATPGPLETSTLPIQQALAASNFSALATAAAALSVAPQQVATVAIAAASVAKAAAITPVDTVALANLVANLVSVARSEDTATDVDRVENENDINQQIDSLNTDIQTFIAANSGVYAIWDQIKGGADTSSLTTEIANIQNSINTSPLSVAGRGRVNARLTQVAGTIQLPGWTMWALGAAGLFAWHWASAKAAAVASQHAATVSGKLQKHVQRKLGMKVEDEEEKEAAADK